MAADVIQQNSFIHHEAAKHNSSHSLGWQLQRLEIKDETSRP